MFKRLFAALAGKKSSEQMSSQEKSSDSAEDIPAHDIPAQEGPVEMISAYREDGSEVHVEREKWLAVAKHNMKNNWDNPDELYRWILMLVDDGFAAEVIEEGQHLMEIDPIRERAYTIYGIVLMSSGKLDEAEAVLMGGMKKYGERVTLLTNLAKVIWEKGDENRAMETLWRAVQLDPNFENSLMWWLTSIEERDGEAAYLEALHKVIAMPGAWRASIILGQYHLAKNEIETTDAIFCKVLNGQAVDSAALMMMADSLGRAGYLDLLIERIGAVYVPEKDNPEVGLSLLQACKLAGRKDDGQKLLAIMYDLKIPPLKQRLDEWAAEFKAMPAG